MSCGGGGDDDDSTDGTILEVLAGKYLCGPYIGYSPAITKSKQLRWLWSNEFNRTNNSCSVSDLVFLDTPYCPFESLRAQYYEETDDMLIITYDIPIANINAIYEVQSMEYILTLNRDSYQVEVIKRTNNIDYEDPSNNYSTEGVEIMQIENIPENIDDGACFTG